MGRSAAVVVIGLAVVAAAAVVGVMTCGGDETAPLDANSRAGTAAVGPAGTQRAASPRRGTSVPSDVPPADAGGGADPAEARITVRARVVTEEDRAPLAGATVFIADEDLESDERSATTDATGAASVEGRAPGPFAFRASAEGRVRSDWMRKEGAAGATAEVEILLRRGVLLDGLVLDAASGKPLGGAQVVVEAGGSIDGTSTATSEAPFGTATTGEDGRFQVRVAAGEMATPTITARGHARLSKTVIVPAGDAPRAPFEFRLEAAGRVVGKVSDPDGAVVAGARVYAVPSDEEMLVQDPDLTLTGGGRTRSATRTRTDAEGRYELDGLAFGGSYRILARAEDWAQSATADAVTTTPEAPAAIVDLRLRRHGAVVLRVVDPEGHGVAAGAVVSDGGWPEMMQIDDTGVLRLERRNPGSLGIDLSPAGFVVAHVDVDVEEGRTAERSVTLERGVAISGKVVDDRGEGVAGATVHVRRPWGKEGHSLSRSEGETKSAPDGAFRVEGLRPGAHIIGAYAAAGHAMTEDAPLDVPADAVRIVMLRMANVRFRLVVPDGCEPPAEVYFQAGHLASFSTPEQELWGGSGGTEPFGDGTFHRPFEPGASRLRVLTTGYASIVRRFDVKPGEDFDLGPLRLDLGLVLTGRVQDGAGAPVPGARVTVGQTMTPEYQTVSAGPDGTFRLEHLAPGKAEISVEAAGFLPATAEPEVATGGAATIVRMARGVLLRVFVVDGEGRPVPGADVTVRRPDAPEEGDSAADETTDHRGRVEVRVPAGKWRVAASRPEGAARTADCDGADGGTADAKIVVE